MLVASRGSASTNTLCSARSRGRKSWAIRFPALSCRSSSNPVSNFSIRKTRLAAPLTAPADAEALLGLPSRRCYSGFEGSELLAGCRCDNASAGRILQFARMAPIVGSQY